MNHLTAICIALFMILVASVYAGITVSYFQGVQTMGAVPLFALFLLLPAIALLVGACMILERVTRHRPKMRDKK